VSGFFVLSCISTALAICEALHTHELIWVADLYLEYDCSYDRYTTINYPNLYP